jgi:L-fuconolactonase
VVIGFPNKENMQIVDSHVHVWMNNQKYLWAAEEQDIPLEDALPEDLIRILNRNRVNWAVLVQNIKYRWDNSYVADVIKAYPSLFMGVCRVDPERPDSPDQLSFWTNEHGFRGVRLSPEADARGDWFTGPLMLPLLKRSVDLKIPVLILTKPSRLPDLASLLEKVPEVNVIIDHMADCLSKDKGDFEKLMMLARYPRVYLKIGHIPHNSSESYPWQDTHRQMERVCLEYGARRIMWGSDWPFLLSKMDYSQSISYVQCELQFLTQDDREWILGKTALQFWPFNQMKNTGC